MLKIKKVKPMFTAIVTTMDLYEDDDTTGGIITKQKGTVKEYQKVVSVGTAVRDIKVGDLVCIDPTRFAVRKHDKNSIRTDVEGGNPILEYRFDIIEMNDSKYLLLQDRDIQFIIEDYEEVKPEKSNIIQPPSVIV